MTTLDDYKKPTNFTGGISHGGGDLGSAPFPQPGYHGVILTVATPAASITLPAGTIVWGYMVMPAAVGAPTAGTVDAGYAGDTDAYMDGVALDEPSDVALNDGDDPPLATPVTLAADQLVTFTSTALDGDVYVGLRISHPAIRR